MNRQMRRLQAKEETRAKKQQQQPAPKKERTGLRQFLHEVRAELKKVTWPSRGEVKNTTVVVILTTVFFGFYLYGLDIAFSWVMRRVMGSS